MSASSAITIAFQAAGTQAIEAQVHQTTPDMLKVDDGRRLSVDVRERIDVLLVDGRPGADLLSGEAGFLATALAPRLSRKIWRPMELGPTGPNVTTPVGVRSHHRTRARCGAATGL